MLLHPCADTVSPHQKGGFAVLRSMCLPFSPSRQAGACRQSLIFSFDYPLSRHYLCITADVQPESTGFRFNCRRKRHSCYGAGKYPGYRGQHESRRISRKKTFYAGFGKTALISVQPGTYPDGQALLMGEIGKCQALKKELFWRSMTVLCSLKCSKKSSRLCTSLVL